MKNYAVTLYGVDTHCQVYVSELKELKELKFPEIAYM